MLPVRHTVDLPPLPYTLYYYTQYAIIGLFISSILTIIYYMLYTHIILILSS